MAHKRTKKESYFTTRARVTKEMAKPRVTRSARVAERNLDTARIPVQLSAPVFGGATDQLEITPSK